MSKANMNKAMIGRLKGAKPKAKPSAPVSQAKVGRVRAAQPKAKPLTKSIATGGLAAKANKAMGAFANAKARSTVQKTMVNRISKKK